jgi:hypothetical protein
MKCGWRYSSTILIFDTRGGKWSALAPVALALGRGCPGQEARWAIEPVWTVGKRYISHPC